MKQPAITVKQPWASLIVEGVKDIENRTWKCPQKYIGKRVLIHAGQEVIDNRTSRTIQTLARRIKEVRLVNALSQEQQRFLMENNPDLWYRINERRLNLGAIIGSVEIVDCTINHPSIWAEKTIDNTYWENGVYHREKAKPIYNWILANPIKFQEPIPCKGKLSFWEYKGELPEKY